MYSQLKVQVYLSTPRGSLSAKTITFTSNFHVRSLSGNVIKEIQ